MHSDSLLNTFLCTGCKYVNVSKYVNTYRSHSCLVLTDIVSIRTAFKLLVVMSCKAKHVELYKIQNVCRSSDSAHLFQGDQGVITSQSRVLLITLHQKSDNKMTANNFYSYTLSTVAP